MGTTSPNVMRDLAWEPSPLVSGSRKGVIRTAYQAMREATTSIVSQVIKYSTPESGQLESSPLFPMEPRNRFSEAIKRIEYSQAYAQTITPHAPYGFFRGRPIIGESTRINGGIYLSATATEAIVVDEKYGVLAQLAELLLSRCHSISPATSTYEYDVFSKTVLLTRETLRYSEEGVQAANATYQIKPDEKVTLDLYIKRKVGLARHQVLLVAFLLERLREDGVIKGQASIEGVVTDDIPQERLLFSSSDGEVFRFDPTKGLGKTAIH